MDVKSYFRAKRETTNYCDKGNCHYDSNECPLSIMNNSMHVNCIVLEQEYPRVAELIMEKYLNDYTKE